ncbi:hypothetical protein [Pseudonocardia oroxyli]|uniref:hypothetical protein n=1 Tax=Pseudonocardia oroxyli TaxID=366584 RepID=UPI0015A10BF7|nr:hypothetical protein [Pseudonocardia oroxyli]
MRIDPELRVAAARPRLDRADPATARRLTAGPAPEAVADVTVWEHEVPSTDGHAVRLRRYRPDDRTFAGTVYHVHGGGFVLGDLDSGHLRNAEIARSARTWSPSNTGWRRSTPSRHPSRTSPSR